MTQPEHRITIMREIAAPAGEVYAAWTNPDVMRRWISSEIDADVRVGGSYRHVVDAGEAGKFVHTGVYMELEPERRIVQTFHGGSADATPGDGTSAAWMNERLEITLRSLGPERTEMTFSDIWEGEPLNAGDTAATQAAWSAWLDQLDALFKRDFQSS